MVKWEYRSLTWGDIRKLGAHVTGEDFLDENVDAGLRTLGREGWELVGVYVDGYRAQRAGDGGEALASSRYVKYTFKRPVEQ